MFSFETLALNSTNVEQAFFTVLARKFDFAFPRIHKSI
jgi:hypothetical protein